VLAVALNRALRLRGFFASRPEPDLRQWLDLVALGTVCDLVPLTGLNRALVAQGLKVAARGANPGLAALAATARLDGPPDAGHFGFLLGPRINAGGRTGLSSLGATLLCGEAGEACTTIARQLDALNAERRRIEQQVLAGAETALAAALKDEAPLLLAAGDTWSPGVVGIVASRLVERYHRPALVVGIEDGIGKGSGRSIPGFDLGAAVIAARQEGLLLKGGGHPMAAGLSVAAGKIDDLRAFLGEHMIRALGPGVPPPPDLKLDAALEVGGLSLALGEALKGLAPFGRGNPEPRFLLAEARVHQARRIGDSHLDCWLSDRSGKRIRAVAFRVADRPLGQALLTAGEVPLQLAGRLKIDVWQGQARAGFQIEDAAPA
jgi:single-stranded-DNA-specific exonuclease